MGGGFKIKGRLGPSEWIMGPSDDLTLKLSRYLESACPEYESAKKYASGFCALRLFVYYFV